MRLNKLMLGSLALCLVTPLQLSGQSCTTSTCNAAGVSQAQVLAALPSTCPTGTTVVNIPSGTASWTTGLTYTVPANCTNLTIQGNTSINCTGTAGQSSYSCTPTNSTIIQDSYNSVNSMMAITMGGGSAAACNFRMTGLTIQGGVNSSPKNNGILEFDGNCNQFRIDHNNFDMTTYSPTISGFPMRLNGGFAGVLDHNIQHVLSTQITSMVDVWGGIGDTIGWGDSNWAAPTNFGSSAFLFFENNYMNGGYLEDCYNGGNFVARYNSILNGGPISAVIHSHGTYDAGGRGRSCRAYEAYHNYIQGPSPNDDAVFGSTGGPSLVWGNILAGGYNWFAALGNSRQDGAHTANAPPAGWGYCGTSAPLPGGGTAGVTSAWDGNSPSTTGYPCLDDLGRGQGQALNGAYFTPPPGALNSVTGTVAWPAEKLEPIYYFNNSILNGAAEIRINDLSSAFNRDVYGDCGLSNSGCTGSFNGTQGTGSGLHSARPATCTAGPGGTYGVSPTGSYGVAYWAIDDNSGNGELWVCTATNTWTGVYQPYVYPHPLVSPSFTLSVSVTGSGSVVCTPTGSGISAGTPFSCIITPGTGYSTSTVTGCGGTWSSSPYTGTMPSSNCTVAATFISNSYTLSTATTGTGSCAITGCAGAHNYNSAFSCSITPAAGSTLGTVSGCGGSGSTIYSGLMPASNCTVTAPCQGTAATPTLSPTPGTYGPPQSVTLADATSGATIYYTLDGSTPTSGSTVYTGAFTVSTTTTVKAIAAKTGWTNSAVASGTYTFPGSVSAPIFAPVPDTYASALPIAILSVTPGAIIRYTTDGSTPTSSHGTVYTAGVSIASSVTLKAVAYESGLIDSSVTSGNYVISGTPSILFTATLSSNANSMGIVATPSRKQLGNVGTGCNGSHVITPTGVPVGQLYATAAIRTAAIAAGCATQNAVTSTSSGVGIQAMDNGQGAGGTDSPLTQTNTYGGSSDDAICSGDPNNALATPITGLSPLGCVSNSSAVFATSTAAGHGNNDVLWPSDYVSNSTTLDSALYYYRDMYWIPDNVSTLHDWEFDVNINSSPTAYAGSTGAYTGWGFDWGGAAGMFRSAPQGQPWTVLLGIDIDGVSNLNSYPLTSGHVYRTRNFGHRRAGCTATSGSKCMFYDYLTVYDVTAGTSPKTFALVDASTGQPVGGIPVNHSSWASGPDMQVQIDMTAAAASTQVRVISDTTVFYGSTPATTYTWNVTATHGSLSGLNCGAGTYASGNTIGDCTAVPDAGYAFTSWSGVSGSAACSGTTNPCPAFSIGANSAATATFTAIPPPTTNVLISNAKISGSAKWQ